MKQRIVYIANDDSEYDNQWDAIWRDVELKISESIGSNGNLTVPEIRKFLQEIYSMGLSGISTRYMNYLSEERPARLINV